MTEPEPPQDVRPARSDAVRNRGLILEAAAGVFASRGAAVDVREIARRAGVGMGTLYRHFPTKEGLLETVLRRDFTEWTRAARAAAASQPDPARALAGFFHDALERQSRHRALAEGFAQHWDASGDAACRRELYPVIDELVARCHAAGVLRGDTGTEEVSLLLVGLGAAVQLAAARGRPEPARRALQVVLDGLLPRHEAGRGDLPESDGA